VIRLGLIILYSSLFSLFVPLYIPHEGHINKTKIVRDCIFSS
jgi:hypothetical protein